MSLAHTITRERTRRDRRYALVSALFFLCLLVLAWLELSTGEIPFTHAEILTYFRGGHVSGADFAIGELRLPRAIVGACAGGAFGMAGYASQTLLRNQLASPDIIGISYGASAGAVAAILLFNWSGMQVTLIALPAGLFTAFLIYVLAAPGLLSHLRRRGAVKNFRRSFSVAPSVHGGRLILIGIGVSAVLSSAIEYLQIRSNVHNASETLRWLSGSLSHTSWDHVPFLIVTVSIFGALLVVHGRGIVLLSHGEQIAAGIGVSVATTSLVSIAAVVGLSSAATAATGPIAFVSFLAGPLARLCVGHSDRSLLLPAALMGAVLVLGADLCGQTLFPYRLPVGLVTSLVGAPYLILQLVRINRHGGLG